MLKILMTAWAKINRLLDYDQCLHKLKWDKGTMLENEEVKLCWNFEYKMRIETIASRHVEIIEYKNRKLI